MPVEAHTNLRGAVEASDWSVQGLLVHKGTHCGNMNRHCSGSVPTALHGFNSGLRQPSLSRSRKEKLCVKVSPGITDPLPELRLDL